MAEAAARVADAQRATEDGLRSTLERVEYESALRAPR
jgi:hypothetical protein